MAIAEQERTAAPDELMSLEDAAAHLGRSVTTVRRMIDRGELPAFQLAGRRGRPLRVRRGDVERLWVER